MPTLRQLRRFLAPARTVRRRYAALLIRHDIQIDYSNAAFTSTVVLAGPRPAAELAHNMTLQFQI